MKKRPFGLVTAILFTFLVPLLSAQATSAGFKSPRFQFGGGAMYLNLDYGNKPNYGVSGWFDANVTSYLGLEVEGHFGTIVSPTDYGQNSYLVGPRFTHKDGKAQLYVKAMIGRGQFVFDEPAPKYYSKNYNIYAGGGGIDLRLSHNFNLRLVDAEYQVWPDFHAHGLTPYAVSTGVMYIIQ